nr:hypothetical protein [Helicobacter didelphidarum]
MLVNYYVLHFTDLRILGVGFATIIGRVCAVTLLLIVIYWKLKIRFSWQGFFLQKDVIAKILNIVGFSARESYLDYTIYHRIFFCKSTWSR